MVWIVFFVRFYRGWIVPVLERMGGICFALGSGPSATFWW